MFAFITRIRPVPLALGVFFTLVTGRVLFDDVITSKLPWLQAITTTHALTLAGIVAAIASGHYALAEFRRWHIFTGFALLQLFVASTVYVTVGSGSRTAEQAAVKVVNATDIAEKRAAAKSRLDKAEAELAAEKAHANDLRAKADIECSPEKGGKGKKCDGITDRSNAAASVVEKSQSHVDRLRAAYDVLKPAPPANAGYAHFAKIITAFAGGDAEAITAKVALAMPFAIVLITELATIVFLHMAFAEVAPRAHSIPDVDTLTPEELEEARKLLGAPTNSGPGDGGPNGGTALPHNVIEHPVVKALRQGAANSNDELAHRLGESKGEASKKRGEVRNYLEERKVGRHTVIDLKPEVRRALG